MWKTVNLRGCSNRRKIILRTIHVWFRQRKWPWSLFWVVEIKFHWRYRGWNENCSCGYFRGSYLSSNISHKTWFESREVAFRNSRQRINGKRSWGPEKDYSKEKSQRNKQSRTAKVGSVLTSCDCMWRKFPVKGTDPVASENKKSKPAAFHHLQFLQGQRLGVLKVHKSLIRPAGNALKQCCSAPDCFLCPLQASWVAYNVEDTYSRRTISSELRTQQTLRVASNMGSGWVYEDWMYWELLLDHQPWGFSMSFPIIEFWRKVLGYSFDCRGTRRLLLHQSMPDPLQKTRLSKKTQATYEWCCICRRSQNVFTNIGWCSSLFELWKALYHCVVSEEEHILWSPHFNHLSATWQDHCSYSGMENWIGV